MKVALRWIAVIPAALLASVIITVFAGITLFVLTYLPALILGKMGFDWVHNVHAAILNGAAWLVPPIAFVQWGTITAPSHRKSSAITLGAISAIFSAITPHMEILMDTPVGPMTPFWQSTLGIIGSVVGVFWILNMLEENNVNIQKS